MIALDASAVVGWLLQIAAGQRIEQRSGQRRRGELNSEYSEA
jgi:hypothetical protein